MLRATRLYVTLPSNINVAGNTSLRYLTSNINVAGITSLRLLTFSKSPSFQWQNLCDRKTVIVNDKVIGLVTSGTISPSLNKGIGIAYVDKSHTTKGAVLSVKIRNKLKSAVVVKAPFYSNGTLSNWWNIFIFFE